MIQFQSKKFLGFDVTPRKEYLQRVRSLEYNNDLFMKTLRERQLRVEDLEKQIEGMQDEINRLRLSIRSLQDKLPKRDKNGRFTKKYNKN